MNIKTIIFTLAITTTGAHAQSDGWHGIPGGVYYGLDHQYHHCPVNDPECRVVPPPGYNPFSSRSYVPPAVRDPNFYYYGPGDPRNTTSRQAPPQTQPQPSGDSLKP
jgi:hypothetical protein